MQSSKVCILCNTSYSINAFRINLIKFLKVKGAAITLVAYSDQELHDAIREDVSYFPVDLRARLSVFSILRVMLTLQRLKLGSQSTLLAYGIFNVIYAAMIKSNRKVLILTGLGSGYLNSRLTRGLFNSLLIIANVIFDELIVLNSADKLVVSRFFFKPVSIHFGEGQEIFILSPNVSKTEKPIRNYSYVGRLVEDKGLLDFLKLAQSLPNMNFNIFGDFDKNNPTSVSYEKFNAMIAKLDNVIWHGHQERGFIWSQTDCLVMTSKREGISTVVLEAISNHVPVVGYGVPGVIDIFKRIEVKNPCLVSFGDLSDLKKAMLSIQERPPYDLELAAVGLSNIINTLTPVQFKSLGGIADV